MSVAHDMSGLDRYQARNGYFVRVWKRHSCGFESDGLNERREVVDDALIEPVEGRSALVGQLGVSRQRERRPAVSGA